MGKLHELLAVEGDLKGKANKVLAETLATFKNKGGHFDSLYRVYMPDTDDGLKQPEETKPMVDTVDEKLNYTFKALGQYMDAAFQKEATNATAKADFVVGGKTLAKDVPATVLLSIENRMTEFRKVYEQIPTLDPSEDWSWDDTSNDYKAENHRVRSKKEMKNHVVSPATDKHPAQVTVFNEDVRIGLVKEVKHSSKFTPARKSAVLSKVDEVIQSAKPARQRANTAQIVPADVSTEIFNYINVTDVK